ncbi:MAG: GNAT family N-acetyltransferase [Alphaproteobacteria bacterium]|nr:GNAT family N-acetyltransferase [Alphaproteobacteria bacterium]
MAKFEPIVTERLVLRPFEARDRVRLIKLANNWRVAKNLSTMPFPYTEAAADTWLSMQEGLWAGGKTVTLVIDSGGELIGGIGVGVRDHDEWEMGYWLGEPYWNRGYVSEAARVLRDYAFDALKLDKIVAGHYPDNHASGAILTKLGFRYTKETMRQSLALGAKVKCLDMALPRERWLALRSPMDENGKRLATREPVTLAVSAAQMVREERNSR